MNPTFYKKHILENKILRKYNIQEYFENQKPQKHQDTYDNENTFDIKPDGSGRYLLFGP